jgi:hypothetical protein
MFYDKTMYDKTIMLYDKTMYDKTSDSAVLSYLPDRTGDHFLSFF